MGSGISIHSWYKMSPFFRKMSIFKSKDKNVIEDEKSEIFLIVNCKS